MPGIGNFNLKTNAAGFDFPSRSILPPSFVFQFIPGGSSPSKQFFKWLAEAVHITERDAVIRFNDFTFDLKNKLAGGSRVKWSGVGELFSGLGGEIKFLADPKKIVFGDPVPAEKIINKNAMHLVMVGEKEKTSDEMKEILTYPEVKKSKPWLYTLIIGLAAVLFICLYFFANGLEVSSSGSRQKVLPEEMTSTHYDFP